VGARDLEVIDGETIRTRRSPDDDLIALGEIETAIGR
jgi:hypothetical protein